MVPIPLAALGELVAERSGVFNIGLEGMMAAGAYLGFLVMLETLSPWAAAIAGMVAGMAIAALMAGVSVYGGANQIVTGFALFRMAPGIVDFPTPRTPIWARLPPSGRSRSLDSTRSRSWARPRFRRTASTTRPS